MMLLAALLAMLVVAGVPAIAQVGQEFEQEADSGDVDQSFEVTGGGDNSNQCVNVTGNTNTGNLQTETGILQYASDIEEFEQDDVGNDLTVEGTSTVECDQQVNQAAAAG
jgi:HPt (histidine-containing phosphotransfer) domain-containing protein